MARSARRKPRCADKPPTREAFAAAADLLLSDAKGLRAQRLQDRAGAPGHRPRVDAGGGGHAAIAIQQEDPCNAMASLHRHRRPPASTAAPRSTGEANTPAEFNAPDLLYGAVVSSTIAQGPHQAHRHEPRARASTGVLDVFTHENRAAHGRSRIRPSRTRSRRPARRSGRSTTTRSGSTISRSRSCGAENGRSRFSPPRWCRSNTRNEPHVTDLDAQRDKAYVPPKKRTSRRRSRAATPTGPCAAEVRHRSGVFHVPIEHHNPMEPFATTVVWEGGGKLTVYDKTQGVQNVQRYICSVFGIKPEDVRVVSPFVGGGFGAGLRPQYQVLLAVMGALALNAPSASCCPARRCSASATGPATIERLALGAEKTARLMR